MASRESKRDGSVRSEGEVAAGIPGWMVAPEGRRRTLDLAESFQVWCGEADGWADLRGALEGRGPPPQPRDAGEGWVIRFGHQHPFSLPASGGQLRFMGEHAEQSSNSEMEWTGPDEWVWLLWVDAQPFAGRLRWRTDVAVLRSLPGLCHLDLSSGGANGLEDLSPLTALKDLCSLDLSNGGDGVTDLQPLAGLKSLSFLNLNDCKWLSDLRPLKCLTNLTELHLCSCDRLTELGPLASLTGLKHLSLAWCRQLGNVSALKSLTNLATLDLHECPNLTDLGPLASLRQLERLDLHGCERISDLRPLSGLERLRRLDISWCKRVRDLSPLASSTALTRLDLFRCEMLTDLSPLQALTDVVVRRPKGSPISTDCKDELFRESVARDVCEHLHDLFWGSRAFEGFADPEDVCRMSWALDRATDKLCALAGVEVPAEGYVPHPWDSVHGLHLEHLDMWRLEWGDLFWDMWAGESADSEAGPRLPWFIDPDGREETRNWMYELALEAGDDQVDLLEACEGRSRIPKPVDGGWMIRGWGCDEPMLIGLTGSGGMLRVERSSPWLWLLRLNDEAVAGETWLSEWKCRKLPTSLSYLCLYSGDRGNDDLSCLAPLGRLEQLAIRHCEDLEDLRPLKSLKNLMRLEIRDCPKVTGVDALLSLKGLKTVWLNDRWIDLDSLRVELRKRRKDPSKTSKSGRK